MRDDANGSSPSRPAVGEGISHGDGRNGALVHPYGGGARAAGDRRGYAAKPLTRLPPPKNPGPAGIAPASSASAD